VITVLLQRQGITEQADRLDPAWLSPESQATVWVDLNAPTDEESHAILRDTFHFNELSIEDAVSTVQYPKIESYGSYLYLVLHGIDFRAAQHQFATHDVDFFLGPNYLVTIHDGKTRTISGLSETCRRNDRILAEGPVALLHRIVDGMVDNYRPEVQKLEDKIDDLERNVFENPRTNFVRTILGIKRDISSLRRVALPQRDIVGRLARREFAAISDELAYRFRDVHDHLVRITDEALIFQDRITGILDAHLSTVSNRLNQVMKVLTVLSTIFMPLTVLTGMWGMNVPLPEFPGGDRAQFWWILGIMIVLTVTMLWFFRRKRWI
jgi:magnesium transporter